MSGDTIKSAAKETGMAISTAKQILKIYRKERRIGPKQNSVRNMCMI